MPPGRLSAAGLTTSCCWALPAGAWTIPWATFPCSCGWKPGERQVVGNREVLIGDSVPYFSLLNISGTARGVDITGAKYPLSNAEISADYQYGISNEVLPGQTAAVKVREGNLLLIRVYRDQEEIE